MAEAAVGQPLAGCLVTDSRWHGTTMAGVIAANANNGLGIAGINWSSKLLPVRVVGKCGGYESDIADGLRWAAGLTVAGVPNNPNPARVVNMSLAAGGACSTTMQSAIDAVIATNTTIVAAAGNQRTNASGYSPGNCNSVITVGAVDKNGGKPTYTNFGANVTISAPGGLTSADDATLNILTTHNQGLTTANANNSYFRTTFGTSASTAQVTGIVGLMLGINATFTSELIKKVLQSTRRAFPTGTTLVMPNPSRADCTIANCGSGIVDAAAALNAAANWTNAQPAINFGGYMTIALSRYGLLSIWGQTQYGGVGDPSNISYPVAATQMSGIQQISQHNTHTLALRADGSVWAFGSNSKGQIGDGSLTFRDLPARVAGALLGKQVKAVATGGEHSIALVADGTVWC